MGVGGGGVGEGFQQYIMLMSLVFYLNLILGLQNYSHYYTLSTHLINFLIMIMKVILSNVVKLDNNMNPYGMARSLVKDWQKRFGSG